MHATLRLAFLACRVVKFVLHFCQQQLQKSHQKLQKDTVDDLVVAHKSFVQHQIDKNDVALWAKNRKNNSCLGVLEIPRSMNSTPTLADGNLSSNEKFSILS